MIKKKNFIFCLIGMFIFACLLSCGIYALADSVKFKMAINLKPSVLFSLEIGKFSDSNANFLVDNVNEYSSGVCIFDNVNKSNINSNCSSVSGLLVDINVNALNFTPTSNQSYCLKIKNLTENKYLNFEIYDKNNNIIATNPISGVKNIAYNNEGYLVVSSNAITSEKFTFKILAELIDNQLTEYQVSVNELAHAPAYAGENYQTTLRTNNLENYIVIEKILINGAQNSNFQYTITTGELVINSSAITGKIEIFTYQKPKEITLTIKMYNATASINQTNYTGETSVVLSSINDISCTLTPNISTAEGWSVFVAVGNSEITPTFSTNTTSQKTFTLPDAQITENITIISNVVKAWDGTSAANAYAFGSGTANNPYLIFTAEQLSKFADNTSAGIADNYHNLHFKLMNNIVLNTDYKNWESWTASTTGLNNWQGIGYGNAGADTGREGSENFRGVFNGNGKIVYGMYINTKLHFIGFFGAATYNIYNLGLSHGQIFGASRVGAITGWTGGVVANCFSNINVTGNAYLGGIAGVCRGTIINCYNAGVVVGTSLFGGITGLAGESTANHNPTGNLILTYSTANEYNGFEHYNGNVIFSDGDVLSQTIRLASYGPTTSLTTALNMGASLCRSIGLDCKSWVLGADGYPTFA